MGIHKFKSEQISPDSNSGHKNKKSKPKVISIKSTKKVDIEDSEYFKERWIFEDFDKIMEREIPEYRKTWFDRITPNLILKFSKGFEQIIRHSNNFITSDSNGSKSNGNKSSESVFHYIKLAYESFLKRIIGIGELSETESVLKRCLELSSPKYSPVSAQREEENSKKRVVKSYSVLINEYKDMVDSNQNLHKDFENLKLKMESDLKEYSKRKTEQLSKMKAIIKQLKSKLEDTSKTEVSMSKYKKLKENFKILVNENEDLNNTAIKLKDLVDDLNQKKNKLNFLIFLWMKEGYPVDKLYKNEVKPIDSHRFDVLTPSKFKNIIKKMNEDSKKEKRSKSNGATSENKVEKQLVNDSFEKFPESFFDEGNESNLLNKSQETKQVNHSIDLNWSYEPIVDGPPAMPKKLKIIPSLNFRKLDEYNKAVYEAKKKKMDEKKQNIENEDNNFDELESILKSA